MNVLEVVFSSKQTGVIVVVCLLYVLLIWLTAKRFNDLAPVPELAGYAFTKQAKAWTSSKRYYVAAIVYIALNIGLFRFLLLAPDLVAWAFGSLPQSPTAWLQSAPQDYITPVGAFLLIWLSPNVVLVRQFEESLRGTLQRLGAIPRNVLHNVRIFSNAKISIPAEIHECLAENLDGAFPKSLNGRYIAWDMREMLDRSIYLSELFKLWADPASPFHTFQSRYEEPLKQLRDTTNALREQVGAVSALPEEFKEKLWKDLDDQLATLLRQQHFILGCTLFSLSGTIQERESAFKDLGFDFESLQEEAEVASIASAIRDDIALAVAFLFFVGYPLVIIIILSLFSWKPNDPWWEIWIIWPTMAASMMLVAILPAVEIRRYYTSQDERPYFYHLIAAVVTAVAVPLLIAALKVVSKSEEGTLLEHLKRYSVYSFVGGSLSFGLSLLLDSLPNRRHLWAVGLGVIVAAFGGIAYFASNSDAGFKGLLMVSSVCFVLAYPVGLFIPRAYKRYALKRLSP
jgi:hypothetical protein